MFFCPVLWGTLKNSRCPCGTGMSRQSLGDCRKMVYRIGPDFGSYSRRGNRRLVDSVRVAATRKTDEKTTKMVFYTSVPTL